MNTLSAYAIGRATQDKELMVFDWHKAARLIKTQKPKCVEAGLRDDWEYTGGCIFSNGKPLTNSHAFLASTWAVPEIEIDGEIQECYVMQSKAPRWNADTEWPASALKILKVKESKRK